MGGKVWVQVMTKIFVHHHCSDCTAKFRTLSQLKNHFGHKHRTIAEVELE